MVRLIMLMISCRYIYCGQIILTTHSVLGLLVLADKYNVPDLKECCSTYMTHHLVCTLFFSSVPSNTSVKMYRKMLVSFPPNFDQEVTPSQSKNFFGVT